eukprot:PhF_6_TR24795/c0_g1_i2/m.34104
MLFSYPSFNVLVMVFIGILQPSLSVPSTGLEIMSYSQLCPSLQTAFTDDSNVTATYNFFVNNTAKVNESCEVDLTGKSPTRSPFTVNIDFMSSTLTCRDASPCFRFRNITNTVSITIRNVVLLGDQCIAFHHCNNTNLNLSSATLRNVYSETLTDPMPLLACIGIKNVVIEDSHFGDTLPSSAGCITLVGGYHPSRSVVVRRSSFEQCNRNGTIDHIGSGLFARNFTQAVVEDCTFRNSTVYDVDTNSNKGMGGGMYLEKVLHAEVRRCMFFALSANGGGCMTVTDTTFAIIDSSVLEGCSCPTDGSQANHGGGMAVVRAVYLLLTNIVISNSYAGNGGGIGIEPVGYVSENVISRLYFQNVHVRNAQSKIDGAGIFVIVEKSAAVRMTLKDVVVEDSSSEIAIGGCFSLQHRDPRRVLLVFQNVSFQRCTSQKNKEKFRVTNSSYFPFFRRWVLKSKSPLIDSMLPVGNSVSYTPTDTITEPVPMEIKSTIRKNTTLTRIVSTTLAVVGAVATASVTASTALRVGTTSLLVEQLACSDSSYEDDDSLPVELHPTRVAVFEQLGRASTSASAVVMNSIAVILLYTFHAVVLRIRRKHFSSEQQLMARMNFPMISFTWHSMIYGSVVRSVLYVEAIHITDVESAALPKALIVILFVLFCTPLVFYLRKTLPRVTRAVYMKYDANALREMERARNSLTFFPRLLNRIAYKKAVWKNVEPSSYFKERYGFLFNSFRAEREWYYIVELCVATAMGGMAAMTFSYSCFTVACYGTFVLLTNTLLVLGLHPFHTRHEYMLTVIRTLGETIALGIDCIQRMNNDSNNKPLVAVVVDMVLLVSSIASGCMVAISIIRKVELWIRPPKPTDSTVSSSSTTTSFANTHGNQIEESLLLNPSVELQFFQTHQNDNNKSDDTPEL